ncbi:MAG: XdhC family protein [Chloroflexota bacterium]
MEDIFEEIVRLKREGKRAVLATVVSVGGSAPREEGAKMLVREDGSILGSIGGGSAEAQIMQESTKVMDEGKAKLVHLDLTGEEAAEEGMICGGVMDIFLEPLASRPTLYIFGAGHISVCLAEMARMVGIRIVVADDRDDFANRERFPQADAILAKDFDSIFSELNVGKQSYIVIVTRGHLFDETVLEWAITTECAYIGMIGSAKKVGTVFQHLRDKGASQEVLEKVHAPIGVDIHAQTPEEIAVSILAELIKARRKQ